MVNLKKINDEHIEIIKKNKIELDESVYNELRDGVGVNLHEENLGIFITQIKSAFQSIENEYILLIHNILTSENISNDKANKMIQEIKNSPNKVLLNGYLKHLNDLIKLLQSRITVSHRFKMHSQGKTTKRKVCKENFLNFAKDIWEKDPDITREEIINRFKKSYQLPATEKTIREIWLKKIDPKRKQGERRKRKSAKAKKIK